MPSYEPLEHARLVSHFATYDLEMDMKMKEDLDESELFEESHYLIAVDQVSVPVGRLEFFFFGRKYPAKNPAIAQFHSEIGPRFRNSRPEKISLHFRCPLSFLAADKDCLDCLQLLFAQKFSKMVLSYSAIAKPTADTPRVISMATSKQVCPEASEALSAPAAEDPQEVESQAKALAQTSTSTTETAVSSEDRKVIQHLILDAGPLLSLTPLRHLATNFHTTPMVLAELRDPKAREHWERLALTGVSVKVEPPTAESMAQGVCIVDNS